MTMARPTLVALVVLSVAATLITSTTAHAQYPGSMSGYRSAPSFSYGGMPGFTYGSMPGYAPRPTYGPGYGYAPGSFPPAYGGAWGGWVGRGAYYGGGMY